MESLNLALRVLNAAFADPCVMLIPGWAGRVAGNTAPSDLIPIMTGETTDGITITASRQDTGYEGWRVCDKNAGTGWNLPGGGTPEDEWVMFDAGEGNTINPTTLTIKNYNAGAGIKDFLWQYSNDLVNWNTALTAQAAATVAVQSFPRTSGAPSRAWRVFCVHGWHGQYMEIMEIGMLGGDSTNLVISYPQVSFDSPRTFSEQDFQIGARIYGAASIQVRRDLGNGWSAWATPVAKGDGKYVMFDTEDTFTVDSTLLVEIKITSPDMGINDFAYLFDVILTNCSGGGYELLPAGKVAAGYPLGNGNNGARVDAAPEDLREGVTVGDPGDPITGALVVDDSTYFVLPFELVDLAGYSVILQPKSIVRADTVTLRYALREDGRPVDIAGKQFKFAVKLNLKDAAPLIGPIDGVIEDAAEGTFSISIEGAATDIEPFTGVMGLVMIDADGKKTTLTPTAGVSFSIIERIV